LPFAGTLGAAAQGSGVRRSHHPPAHLQTEALSTTPDPIALAPGPDRVLYIEDNPVNSTLMEAMLEMLPGVQLRCAATAAEGLALAEQGPPQLILLDIQMPDLDGFAVLARLRSCPATQAIPVIAVTGLAGAQDVARGRSAGFTAYLAKPLHLPALLQAVCAALGRPVPAMLPPG